MTEPVSSSPILKLDIPRAIGLARALAHPPVLAKTEEAALIQIEVARVATEILAALDAPPTVHIVLEEGE